MNFCNKCGNKLIPNSIFCNNCGNKIVKEDNNNTSDSFSPSNNKTSSLSSEQNHITKANFPELNNYIINENQQVYENRFIGDNAELNSIIESAKYCLAKKKYYKAYMFCEKALNIDTAIGDVYLIKLLIENKINSVEKLRNTDKPFYKSINYNNFMRFGDEKTKNLLKTEAEIFYNKPLTTLGLLFGNYYKKRDICRISKDEFVLANSLKIILCSIIFLFMSFICLLLPGYIIRELIVFPYLIITIFLIFI